MLRRLKARLFPKRYSIYLRDARKFAKYEIGEWTYGRPTVRQWGEGAKLTIGKYCSIARGVEIFLGGEHRVDWVTTYPFATLWKDSPQIPGHPATKGDVVIGHDVWIASSAVILSGVTIGNGAVIAAHALVAKNVKPYEIVGGNPAKHIRFRFDEQTIHRLEQLAWWNWPQEKVREFLPLLQSDRIEEFLNKAGAESPLPDRDPLRNLSAQ